MFRINRDDFILSAVSDRDYFILSAVSDRDDDAITCSPVL